jgi:hypothetical protein
MEPLYRIIIKKAWWQIKTHKWLWLFGLFAALLGNGGEVDVLFQSNKLTNAPIFLNNLKEKFAALDLNSLKDGIYTALSTAPLISMLSVAITLIFILLLVWLVTVSQGALIESANKLEENKKINFKDALNKGVEKFWSILGLNIATRFILYFTLIILSIPFAILYMFNSSASAITFITILAFVLLVPIAIILSFILKYALAFVVIKSQPAVSAFILSWRLFAANWLISVEMAILLFLINLAVGLLLVIAIVVLALPFLGLVILMILVQNESGLNVALGLGLLITLFLLLFTGAGLAAFQYSAWTLLFQKLLAGKKYPKLIRLTAGKEKNINK